eukprot:EG_transcript_46823
MPEFCILVDTKEHICNEAEYTVSSSEVHWGKKADAGRTAVSLPIEINWNCNQSIPTIEKDRGGPNETPAVWDCAMCIPPLSNFKQSAVDTGGVSTTHRPQSTVPDIHLVW